MRADEIGFTLHITLTDSLACTHAYVATHTCTHAYVAACIRSHYACICGHTYVRIYTRTYTYTHTYVRIYLRKRMSTYSSILIAETPPH